MILQRLAVLALLAGPVALADEPEIVSPSEFRAYAEGYTLYYERDGEAFGSEAFRPGNIVTWRFESGTCVDGAWEVRGAQVCFKFVGTIDEPAQCWRVLRDGEGLFVRLLTGEDDGFELRITERDTRPLQCLGPSEDA